MIKVCYSFLLVTNICIMINKRKIILSISTLLAMTLIGCTTNPSSSYSGDSGSLSSSGISASNPSSSSSEITIPDIDPLKELDFLYDSTNENYWVKKAKSEDINGNLVIPSTYNGKPVVGIQMNAFQYCKSLKSVTLPSTIKEIESSAFYLCEKLESVTLNEGLKTISFYSFYRCESLKSIIVPDTVTFL